MNSVLPSFGEFKDTENHDSGEAVWSGEECSEKELERKKEDQELGKLSKSKFPTEQMMVVPGSL